jgi:hypothetical protein
MRKIVFKNGALMELAKVDNAHRLAMRAGVSYSAVTKYVNHPETVDALDMTVFASLLLRGLELSPDAALDLRIGDLFEFVESPKE